MSAHCPPPDPPDLPDSAVRRRLLLPLLQERVIVPAAQPPVEASPEPGASFAELHALLRFAEALPSRAGTADAAALLLETVVSTYGFPRGAVLGGEQNLVILARHGLGDELASTGTSATVRAALAASSPVVAVPDMDGEPWLTLFAPAGATLLVQPLQQDERRFGALVLQLPGALAEPRRVVLCGQVRRLAAMTSEAMHRDHRLRALQRLAATDDLTMIANRRSFDASLEREVARSLRSGEPLSLALFDLDLFKRVNDVYGHPAGDDLLRNVAAALVIACRDLDTPARYGGEEFAVILPDCAPEHCLLIVDRLRLAIAAAPGVTSITASAGVATFPHHASTVESLIDAADQALLAAKRAGRNQTRLADGNPDSAPCMPTDRGTVT